MKKPIIICVDDEKFILDGLRTALVDAFGDDYMIEIAEDGVEALEMMKEFLLEGEDVPLVISDYVMPGMKGDELLKHIQIISQRTFKIMLTGQATMESVTNALNQADLYRYMAKPWDNKNLTDTVRHAVDQYYQAKQSDKMEAIGTLAGGIAHDFNNMLGVITGNVSYALSIADKESELFEVLSDIQEGARQAHKLTHQLLTFAKGGEPIKQSADINNLVRESASFSIRGSKSRCEFNLENGLWSAQVDPGQFSQAIGNLIINADQSMPDGGIITIRTENMEIKASEPDFSLSAASMSEGTYIRIFIEDQGGGIPEKHLANIFDPYFTIKQKGSGLGLATSYSIIRRH
ncbi:MAG: response regulator, partial [Desulfamplus sp.]|nr:response regulator [Desulfamplus sp.]